MDKKIEDLIEEETQKNYINLVIPPHPPDWNNFIWHNSNKVVYGPVDSRRLGKSLGINLFPNSKACNFSCVYCDCGITDFKNHEYSPLDTLKDEIKNSLMHIKEKDIHFNYLTFAGNGEPTMHPDFSEIASFTSNLLHELYEGQKMAIFSNGTMLSNDSVTDVLMNLFDVVYLKLDAGNEADFKKISRPHKSVYSFGNLIEHYSRFGKFILSCCVINDDTKHIDSYKSKEFVEIVSKTRPQEINFYAIEYPTFEAEANKKHKLRYSVIQEFMELSFYLAQYIDVPIKIFLRRNSCEDD